MKFSKVGRGFAAVTLGVLVLSGCSDTADTAEGDDEAGVTTISYWGWDGAPGRAVVEPMIAAFEAENPTIKVDYTELSQTDFKPKVAQSLRAGEAIDVLTVQPGAWASEIEDYLLPVADWPNADIVDSFTEQSVDQASRMFRDGNLMAVPVYSTGSAVGIYNADVIAELGVEPPVTREDFAELSAAIEAQDSDLLPVVMPSEGWFQDEVVLTMVGQDDPDFFNSVRYDDGKWNTDSYVTALEEYKELFDTGVFNSDTLDLDYASAMSAFDDGRAAVVFNGTWEATRILSGNYGLVPFPADVAGDASLRSFLDVMVGIPAESSKQDAAAQFIEFMSVGAGVDEYAATLKGVPALEGYEMPEGVLTTELQQQSYDLLVELINNPSSDRNNLGAFSDTVGANVKQVLFGQMTAEEAADAGQEELERGNF